MTLAECWRLAAAMVISDHAIERYFLRSSHREASTAADVEECIRSEFVRSWGTRRFHQLLEEGAYPRIAVLWKCEPLVTLVRPAPPDAQPVVLTVLTYAMYDTSLRDGRYRRAA